MAEALSRSDPLHMSTGHTTDLCRLCAGPGSTVEVVDRAGRTTIYELVTRRPHPAPRRVTVASAEGIALLGARPGDALTIPTSNGRHRRVSVVEVTPQAPGGAREGVPARRRARDAAPA